MNLEKEEEQGSQSAWCLPGSAGKDQGGGAGSGGSSMPQREREDDLCLIDYCMPAPFPWTILDNTRGSVSCRRWRKIGNLGFIFNSWESMVAISGAIVGWGRNFLARETSFLFFKAAYRATLSIHVSVSPTWTNRWTKQHIILTCLVVWAWPLLNINRQTAFHPLPRY